MTEEKKKGSMAKMTAMAIMSHADLKKVEALMRGVHELLGAFEDKGTRLGAIDVSYAFAAMLAESAEDLGGDEEFQSMIMIGLGEIAAEMVMNVRGAAVETETSPAANGKETPVNGNKAPPDEGTLAAAAEERRRKAEVKNTPERGTQTGRLPSKGFSVSTKPGDYVMNHEEFTTAVEEGMLKDAEGVGYLGVIKMDDEKQVAFFDKTRAAVPSKWKKTDKKNSTVVVWFGK